MVLFKGCNCCESQLLECPQNFYPIVLNIYAGTA